jgi:hypothetical protein
MRPILKTQMQLLKTTDHKRVELAQIHPADVADPVVYLCFIQA